jgi:RNA polymerase sigma-70 factor (ECF subfamily)
MIFFILRKLHCFSGESRFSTWLYSVTSNYGINYLNRNTKNILEFETNKRGVYLATEINDYSLSQLQLDRLEMALTKIKPEESMILKLKYQEGASVKRCRKYWVCPKAQ